MSLSGRLAMHRGFRRVMLAVNSLFTAGAVLLLVLSAQAGHWLNVVVLALVAAGNAWGVVSHLEALRDIRNFNQP
jgi:hypothetical protein